MQAHTALVSAFAIRSVWHLAVKSLCSRSEIWAATLHLNSLRSELSKFRKKEEKFLKKV